MDYDTLPTLPRHPVLADLPLDTAMKNRNH